MTNTNSPTITAADACVLLNERCGFAASPDELRYSCWWETYGDTAGPFGGVGGQAITAFRIEAWEYIGMAVVFCGGRVLAVSQINIDAFWGKRRK